MYRKIKYLTKFIYIFLISARLDDFKKFPNYYMRHISIREEIKNLWYNFLRSKIKGINEVNTNIYRIQYFCQFFKFLRKFWENPIIKKNGKIIIRKLTSHLVLIELKIGPLKVLLAIDRILITLILHNWFKKKRYM